ncbi:MAG: riboflavin synthase [Synergistaceae bacterium]|nr:riboflavin synthase [Synergistaceae bacterium]
MFTGLIEEVGSVRNFHKTGTFYTLSIESNITSELKIGQSVSISGACLTVTRINAKIFDVQLMQETFTRTWFHKNLRAGTRVNLERAMKLSDRLDGHLVLGHVDGVAALKEIHGQETREAVFIPEDKNLLRGIVEKGSVCIDGVSLTVINAGDSSFSVGLIPETLKATTLGGLKAGSIINLETDILGKYIERLTSFDSKNNKPGNYLTSLLSL